MNGDCILEVVIISGISSRFRLPLDKISKISALEKIFSNNFLIFPIWKNFRPEIWCFPIGCYGLFKACKLGKIKGLDILEKFKSFKILRIFMVFDRLWMVM